MCDNNCSGLSTLSQSLAWSLKAKSETMKIFHNRITKIGTHYKEIAVLMDKYVDVTTKLSRKGENLANEVEFCATDIEEGDIAKSLAKFSKSLNSIQKSRVRLAEEIHNRALSDFLIYESRCKEMKKSVRDCVQLEQKEKDDTTQLEKLTAKFPSERRKIIEAETRRLKSERSAKASRAVLQEDMKRFETKKVEDLRLALADFVRTEMQFHARALQTYTKSYQYLKDLEQLTASPDPSIVEHQAQLDDWVTTSSSAEEKSSALSLRDLN